MRLAAASTVLSLLFLSAGPGVAPANAGGFKYYDKYIYDVTKNPASYVLWRRFTKSAFKY